MHPLLRAAQLLSRDRYGASARFVSYNGTHWRCEVCDPSDGRSLAGVVPGVPFATDEWRPTLAAALDAAAQALLDKIHAADVEVAS